MYGNMDNVLESWTRRPLQTNTSAKNAGKIFTSCKPIREGAYGQFQKAIFPCTWNKTESQARATLSLLKLCAQNHSLHSYLARFANNPIQAEILSVPSRSRSKRKEIVGIEGDSSQTGKG